MGRSYSLDPRVRVAAFVAAGHSRRAAARHFGVSDSFAIKLLRRQAQSGSPTPAGQGRPRGQGKLAPDETVLVQAVEATPDITMPELAARLMTEHGVQADPATRSRLLCRHGFTDKKALRAASAHAPIFVTSAASGEANVSPACARRRTGWCFWTRPSSPPRWCGGAAAAVAANACGRPPPAVTGAPTPSSPACVAVS